MFLSLGNWKRWKKMQQGGGWGSSGSQPNRLYSWGWAANWRKQSSKHFCGSDAFSCYLIYTDLRRVPVWNMEMSGEIPVSVKMETHANTATLAQSSSSIQRYSSLLGPFGSWLGKQKHFRLMKYASVPAGRVCGLLVMWSWDTEKLHIGSQLKCSCLTGVPFH